MKSLSSIFFIWLTLTSMILISNCTAPSETNNTKSVAMEASQITKLSVKTIRCHDCLNTIRRNLLALDGIISVEGSLKDKDNVTVTFLPHKISENVIKSELRNWGHEID